MEKIKILLVEDNPGDAFILEEMLTDSKRFEYELQIAESLAQSVYFLEKNKFSIIILDLGLPDSYGINSFKNLYKDNSNTPIIVITGLKDDETGKTAMSLGAKNFLIKGSFDHNLLSRTIMHSIESHNYLNRIRENEELLASFMDAATDQFALFDKNFELIKANKAMERFFKTDNKSILKEKILNISDFIEKQELLVSLNEVLKTRVPFLLREVEINNDNELKIISLKAFKVQDGLGIVLSDITEIKLAGKELDTKNKLLQEANSSKDRLFSIIAHDLKSPFNSILGFSELLFYEFDNVGVDDKKKYISDIYNAVNNTYKLLDNLLTWARSQTKRIEFNPRELDLKIIVEESMLNLRRDAEKKGIRIKISILDKLLIYADKEMIETVFRNLISNAIKFTSADGIISIEGIKKYDNSILVSVKDTGIGIPSDNINKMFDIGQGFTTPGTVNEKGTGLGMIIVKDFVEKNLGELNVESEVGKGTTISFTIPLANNWK